MDARSALEPLEELCRELDFRRAILRGAFFRKYVRPVGFGVMLSFGAAGAFTGCPEAVDAYGVPGPDMQLDGQMPTDGVQPDTTPWPDIGTAKDMYGVADTVQPDTTPWPDMVEPKDMYGIADK